MTDHIAGDNLIIWEFDYAMTTFYEVDTDKITSLLPKQLSPMEIVPGVSLLNITAFNLARLGRLVYLYIKQDLVGFRRVYAGLRVFIVLFPYFIKPI